MKFEKARFVVIVTTFILLSICLITSDKFIADYGQFLYLIQFLIPLFLIVKLKHNYIYFFSPSFLTFTYVNVTFAFGHYAVSRGLGFNSEFYDSFRNFKSISFITSFFLICSLIVFLSIPFKRIKINSFDKKTNKPKTLNKNVIHFFLIPFLILFNLFDINFDLMGGTGNFNYIFQLSITIILILLIKDQENKVKYLYYIAIVLLYLTFHYDSKREIIFVIILMLFLEFVNNQVLIKLKWRQFLIFSIGFTLLLYLIVVASIMRGYGNFSVDNPIDASKLVYKYMRSDFATDALVANFEFTYAYGNASNAVNYIYDGKVNYLYGSTFIKFIFLPIPRSIYPDKPKSMIDIYTNKFAPSFRDLGGSYPIGIYAEALWNFGFLAFPFLFLIFAGFNKLYLKIIDFVRKGEITTYDIFLLFMYITLIQFVRGSGFELWLAYALIQVPLTYFILLFFRNNSPAISKELIRSIRHHK